MPRKNARPAARKRLARLRRKVAAREQAKLRGRFPRLPHRTDSPGALDTVLLGAAMLAAPIIRNMHRKGARR